MILIHSTRFQLIFLKELVKRERVELIVTHGQPWIVHCKARERVK